MPTHNYQGPGRYRHYKGGEYEVMGLAIAEATLDQVEVIYRPWVYQDLGKIAGWDSESVEFWRRPLDDFNQYVSIDGEMAPRFEKIGGGR
jgi:hypothetical protein